MEIILKSAVVFIGIAAIGFVVGRVSMHFRYKRLLEGVEERGENIG